MRESGRATVLLFFVWLTWFATSHVWVFVLDDANLIFHEAGHVLFMPFGELLYMMGGSIFQILLPTIIAISFLRKREIVSALFALWWAGENMIGVGRYIADARAQNLELIGGEHDWAGIFSRWPSLLSHDTAIGETVRTIGIVIMCVTLILCALVIYRNIKNIPSREAGV